VHAIDGGIEVGACERQVGENPWDGMYSFDNTLNSLVMMPLILTASNWNLLMYRLQESEPDILGPMFFAPAVVVRAPSPPRPRARRHAPASHVRERGRCSCFTWL
jgi:hypothetical protein